MSDSERIETIAYLRRKIESARRNATDELQSAGMRAAFAKCADKDTRRLNKLLEELPEASR